jgi:hypothetical protein
MMKFSSGRCVATPGAQAAVPDARIRQCLFQHFDGHWGELSGADVQANEYALKHGGDRLMSVWRIDERQPKLGKFYIITDADRSVTTVLLPDEY